MHPFVSFITEEIYQKLPAGLVDGNLISATYPPVLEERESEEHRRAASGFQNLQELVRGIRTVRSEFTIPPGKSFPVYVRVSSNRNDIREYFSDHTGLIASRSGIEVPEIGADDSRRDGTVAVIGSGFEAYLSIRELIDIPGQIRRLEKNIEKTGKAFKQAQGKLGSSGFLAKAKPEIVAQEQSKAADLQDQLERMHLVLEELRRTAG
jgi:valyl-tRNA synthetase